MVVCGGISKKISVYIISDSFPTKYCKLSLYYNIYIYIFIFIIVFIVSSTVDLDGYIHTVCIHAALQGPAC